MSSSVRALGGVAERRGAEGAGSRDGRGGGGGGHGGGGGPRIVWPFGGSSLGGRLGRCSETGLVLLVTTRRRGTAALSTWDASRRHRVALGSRPGERRALGSAQLGRVLGWTSGARARRSVHRVAAADVGGVSDMPVTATEPGGRGDRGWCSRRGALPITQQLLGALPVTDQQSTGQHTLAQRAATCRTMLFALQHCRGWGAHCICTFSKNCVRLWRSVRITARSLCPSYGVRGTPVSFASGGPRRAVGSAWSPAGWLVAFDWRGAGGGVELDGRRAVRGWLVVSTYRDGRW